MLVVLLLLLLVSGASGSSSELNISTLDAGVVLRIGAFIPGIDRHDEYGYLTAMDMAMNWLNINHILPDNCTIELDAEETMGTPAYAIYNLGKFLMQPAKVAFLGPAFTKALRPIAEALQLFHVIQVSFGSTAAFFNNLLEYPYLFRTVPTTELFNFARVALIKKYKWKRFALIYNRNDESLALTSSLLLKALVKNGCTVATAVGVSKRDDNYVQILERFKELNVRIIFGDFLSAVARKVFCAAYKTGVYGKKYVWIISGNIRERLTMEDFRVSCTVKEIITASHRAITIGQLNYVLGNETTITGETGPQLYSRYQRTAESLGRKHSTFAGYAFDAIISIGLVIKETFRKVNWKKMNYSNYTAALIAKSAFRKIRFNGMTGPVHFNGQSERKVDIAIQQVIDGKEQLVAVFDNESQVIKFVEGKSFSWHGAKVPLDAEKRIKEPLELSKGMSITLLVFAALGILISIAILILMLKYREFHAIKKCSPNLNIILLIGCFLCYITVFLLAVEALTLSLKNIIAMCKARQWLMVIGFTLSFGAMFAKTFRIYRIMTNKALHKELALISDCHLFSLVVIFLAIDITYLSIWEICDPLHKKLFWLQRKTIAEEDMQIETYTMLCQCNHFMWWVMGIFIYKGCLLLFGLFLAYETRNVYYLLNDSRNIGFTVYNVGVFSILGAVIAMVLKKYQQEFIDGFVGGCVILCTTVTIAIIFLPKVVSLYRNNQAPEEGNNDRTPQIQAPKLLMLAN